MIKRYHFKFIYPAVLGKKGSHLKKDTELLETRDGKGETTPLLDCTERHNFFISKVLL